MRCENGSGSGLFSIPITSFCAAILIRCVCLSCACRTVEISCEGSCLRWGKCVRQILLLRLSIGDESADRPAAASHLKPRLAGSYFSTIYEFGCLQAGSYHT